ncbi:MAG: Uma2 family endonuclease [Armatimonadetes bacterium]|nr:Uma2 family endonuclease [Armatimonadota bacterium]
MSSWVGVTVAAALHQHCGTTGQGLVFNGECGYRLFPERPDLVRKPDVSVVARPRLPGGKIPTGFFALAPDLAVEVISPRDLFYEVAGKVADYLAAGVRQVWVLNPEQRTVTVHTPARVTHLGAPDTLEAGELLPGFQCRVADLFPPVEEETG